MATPFLFGKIPLYASNLRGFSQFLLKQKNSAKNPTLVLPVTMNEIVQAWVSPNFLRKLKKIDYPVTDGMPLVWLARLNKKRSERIYGPDLMLETIEHGQHDGVAHYFYGTTGKVLKKLKIELMTLFPGAKLVGMYAPPFRELTEQENQRLIQRINALKPDFVWVGLGGSKQVAWAVSMKSQLHVRYIIPVGAAFDFISGSKPQAPRWLQKMGLEWLFRLLTEPQRLWKRYVLQIPVFLVLWVTEAVKILAKKFKKLLKI